jgi:sulfite exporter TauE/SafE
MTSIIRQRQLIVGERSKALAFVAVGSVMVAIGVLAWATARTVFALNIATGLIFLAIGLGTLRAARRKLAAFEGEHGAGAGKQPSIR